MFCHFFSISRWAELNKKTDCNFSKQQSADDADKLWEDQSQEDMYLSRLVLK